MMVSINKKVVSNGNYMLGMSWNVAAMKFIIENNTVLKESVDKQSLASSE